MLECKVTSNSSIPHSIPNTVSNVGGNVRESNLERVIVPSIGGGSINIVLYSMSS